MADKENQHFVPQYYFRFYSKNKKSISLLNVASGKTVETASIKGQASKSFFYGDAATEELITQIESSFISTLKKIKSEKSFSNLSEDEILLLLQAIMFQRSRTLAKRKDTKKQRDFMARTMAEIAINTNDCFDENQRKELRDLLKYVVADPIPFQGIDMTMSLTQAHYLMDLRKIVLKNRTKTPFIFSDAPAILINPMQRRVVTRGVLGMKTPGIIVLMPLGPRMAIMLYDKNAYKIIGETKDCFSLKHSSDVDELNKVQICNAASTVYFDDYGLAPYITRLWGLTKAHLENTPKGIVQEGILLDGDDEKEIVHFFEKQIPLMPKLSFVKYEEIDPYSNFIDRDLWDGKRYF